MSDICFEGLKILVMVAVLVLTRYKSAGHRIFSAACFSSAAKGDIMGTGKVFFAKWRDVLCRWKKQRLPGLEEVCNAQGWVDVCKTPEG